MDYDLNKGAGGGVRMGMIVLRTDETLEFEARQVLAGRDAQLLHSRIPNQNEVSPETLAEMERALPTAAGLLPDGLAAIGYGCTSAATVIGEDAVARAIQVAQAGVPVTNPISAVKAALEALGARRIAMVTPYVPSVTAPMIALLAQGGIEVVREISFGEGDDRRVARIAPHSTRAAMLEAGRDDGVDAVFASCTNLQTFPVIELVETELGLPVVTSNQALLWHMLRLAGAQAQGWGPGRLFCL
ncbi:maleate cis-trans isomerase family protein [Roseovarius pelagicus]|uniref:Asp/Glu racemase n=1 Tax=Roseovarius pelagicus TaxID=2980108 RepID=A0ABY6DB97_9RHOB|nr:Asp/Glu racemase [Roseovarius pelagicus]UXX83432.1 Asp/Glu racemase [Roseovarius pelagicus]